PNEHRYDTSPPDNAGSCTVGPAGDFTCNVWHFRATAPFSRKAAGGGWIRTISSPSRKKWNLLGNRNPSPALPLRLRSVASRSSPWRAPPLRRPATGRCRNKRLPAQRHKSYHYRAGRIFLLALPEPPRNRKFADSLLEGDGFELPVRGRGQSDCWPDA